MLMPTKRRNMSACLEAASGYLSPLLCNYGDDCCQEFVDGLFVEPNFFYHVPRKMVTNEIGDVEHPTLLPLGLRIVYAHEQSLESRPGCTRSSSKAPFCRRATFCQYFEDILKIAQNLRRLNVSTLILMDRESRACQDLQPKHLY